MTSEGKFILIAFAATIALVAGLAFFLARNSGEGQAFLTSVEAQGIEANPQSINLGNVAYSGGKVSKDFEIRNSSGKTLKLKKIVTSCMCTTAKFKIGDKESRFFGMEMNGDFNPLVDYDVPAGASATVTFNFDPAAHGPAGVGPFDRVVTLYFTNGFKELKFNGTVVN